MHTLCIFAWLVVCCWYDRQRVGGCVHSSIFFATLSATYNFRWRISSLCCLNFPIRLFAYSFASFGVFIFCCCCCCFCCWVCKFFPHLPQFPIAMKNFVSAFISWHWMHQLLFKCWLLAGDLHYNRFLWTPWPVAWWIEGRSRLHCPLALDWVTGSLWGWVTDGMCTFTGGSYSGRFAKCFEMNVAFCHTTQQSAGHAQKVFAT